MQLNPELRLCIELKAEFGSQSQPPQQSQRVIQQVAFCHRHQSTLAEMLEAVQGIHQLERLRQRQCHRVDRVVAPMEIRLQAGPVSAGQVDAPALDDEPSDRAFAIEHHGRAPMAPAQLAAERHRVSDNHQIQIGSWA
jgi:hypothetical protein